MMKLAQTTIENKTVIEILRVESLLDAIDQVLSSGEKAVGEFTYNPENEKMYLSYVITPFHFSEESQNGALIQLQNVTSLKKLEAIRRDFVANASHELKTPLTAIVGYTETLIDGAANDPQRQMRFMRRIREQAQRLEFLVADLLKLSQLENDLPLELKKVNIIPLLNEISDEFNDQVKQKGLHLTTVSPKKNVFINADKELLRTVFNNLIDNSIKYTASDGKITIRVSEENGGVKLEVIDTGIGIEGKYHERIFQRFYRVDKARSLALGGTGLGLAIVKHIIEKHHSEIFVESQLGQGSRFWFVLEKA
jgi:two-component system phosphate regulon sensor histidine kinase PhoR